jgi:hypothetical protein
MGRPATARLRAMFGHEHVHVYVQSSGTMNVVTKLFSVECVVYQCDSACFGWQRGM